MVCQYAFSIRNVYFKGLYFRVWEFLARNYENPLNNINMLYSTIIIILLWQVGALFPCFWTEEIDCNHHF